MQPTETRPPFKQRISISKAIPRSTQKLILTTLLFSQHTVLAEQELPLPTPMTEMGEQPRPIFAVVSWRTTPRRARRAEPAAELA